MLSTISSFSYDNCCLQIEARAIPIRTMIHPKTFTYMLFSTFIRLHGHRKQERRGPDLLNPYKPRLYMLYTPIWLRTCYNAGTDDIHASLLSSIPANNILNPSKGCILSDAARYSFLSRQPLSSILAFIPLLTETHCNLTSPLYPQPEETTPCTSRELQAQLQGGREEGHDTEEQRKHKRMFHQRSFFAADDEAMRTGYVLWTRCLQ